MLCVIRSVRLVRFFNKDSWTLRVHEIELRYTEYGEEMAR